MKMTGARLGGALVRRLRSRRYVYRAKQGARRLTAGTLAAIFALTILITYAVQVVPTVHAATGDVFPNGDITRGFAACTGTGCTTAHYTTMDEGTTANNTDYANTGTAGSGGEVEEFTMDNSITGASSVTSVAVKVNAWRITTGSTADTISINLRIGGSLQGATTCSPPAAFNATTGWCSTVTFNGTWTQANLDGMQVHITRNVVGSGPGGSRDDDMAITTVYTTVTYTQAPVITQASHRWFDNVDGVSPTDPLAAQDTAVALTAPTGIARLRLNLGIASVALGSSGQNFKLQVAERGSDAACDTSFTNETYGDIGQSTTWQLATDTPGWSGREATWTTVYFNSKMWVIGGLNGGTRTEDVWSSSDGTTWNLEVSNPAFTARENPAVAVFNNKMWMSGGFDGSYLDEVYSSTDGVTWSLETNNPGWAGRYYHGMLTYNNKLWVMGGIGGTGSTRYNDVWSSSDGVTWNQETSGASWSARNGAGYVVFDSKMWVMGGTDGTRKNDVYYSTDGATWTQATSNGGWAIRNQIPVVVKDNMMWILGGYSGTVYYNDVWTSSDGATWSQFDSSADWGTRANSGALVYNNLIWLIGGTNGSGIDEVWYGAGNSDIGFYDNPTPANAANISAITGDPTAGGTIRPQNYQETGTFTNAQAAIAIGEYGVWDFSLYQSNDNAFGKTYCFRVVKSDGSPLDTYSTIPQLTACGAPPNTYQMRHGSYFCADNRRPFTWAR